jgi:hypothetical protein
LFLFSFLFTYSCVTCIAISSECIYFSHLFIPFSMKCFSFYPALYSLSTQCLSSGE